MQTKTKKIINIIAATIPAAMVILSGVMKLTGAKPVVDKLSAMGVGSYIPLFGLMEIGFAALFIGFLLADWKIVMSSARRRSYQSSIGLSPLASIHSGC